MYVIAFANPKGGTGKTTSALLLAEQIALAGASVTILDCDPNQNLVEWGHKRKIAGRKTPFNILPRPDESEVIEIIDGLDGKTDYVIIDLEGTASQVVTFALSRADLAVIPLEPNSVEAPHAAKAVQLVNRTGKMLNRNIPYTLLLNRANAAFQTSEERELRVETTDSHVKVLPVSLIRRAAYTKIFGEASLLDELRSSLGKRAGEREIEQIDKAILNAREVAQKLMDLLEQKEAA